MLFIQSTYLSFFPFFSFFFLSFFPFSFFFFFGLFLCTLEMVSGLPQSVVTAMLSTSGSTLYTL